MELHQPTMGPEETRRFLDRLLRMDAEKNDPEVKAVPDWSR